MRIGIIDIGTNTILLLIADIYPAGTFTVLHDEQIIARLGKGVDAEKNILPDTFVRVKKYLSAYLQKCQELKVNRVIATGTSALRDAGNREEFCAYIHDTLGLQIEILSGDEEARWTYRGGISEFRNTADSFGVIDIGGGSTEIIQGNAEEILFKKSFDIGCVRLTERILRTSPPTDVSISQAKEEIISHFQEFPLPDNFHSSKIIAVAGTATTLASFHQHLPQYDPIKVSGYKLRRSDIENIFEELKVLSIEQIRQFPQIASGRADIILAGVIILLVTMTALNVQSVLVSDRGLRYGMLLREIEKISI